MFKPEWPNMPKAAQLVCRANIVFETGKNLEAALALYREASLLADDPLIWRNMGHLNMKLERWTEAEECYRRSGSAFWLANLYEWLADYDKAWKVIQVADPSAARAQLMGRISKQVGMEREGIAALRPYETAACLLERARLHDSIGEYEQAWEAAVAGNLAKGDRCPNPFPDRTYELPSEANTDAPIFIVGMPRSGTTLMERMIAQHPDVVSLNESEYFNTVDALLRTGRNVTDIGLGYVGKHLPKRTLDKNPVNFRHVDLIRSVFPDARIIRMVRDRDDIAISAFFRLFDGDLAWGYDWGDIQNAIDRHEELLAGKDVHAVPYADLVSDTESVLRGVLAYCGLEWDDRCLVHNADRTHHKGSYEEVRKPVHTRSVGRAEKYRRFFSALAEVGS